MKRAFIACAAMLLMLVAVGSAKADHRHHGHHGHHGGHSRGATVVVRSYGAPAYHCQPHSWHGHPAYSYHYRPYDYHHHHGHSGIAVGGSGIYFRFGF